MDLNWKVVILIKGHSMIEKGICDGDIAIIKKTNVIQSGKVGAVLTSDNEVTLKTVKINNNKIHLIPANKNYDQNYNYTKLIQISNL